MLDLIKAWQVIQDYKIPNQIYFGTRKKNWEAFYLLKKNI